MRRHQAFGLFWLLGCLLWLGLLAGCQNLKQATLYYADGSGNSYLITPEPRLEYRPVTAAMSSSGVYDGGEPFQRVLTSVEHDQLVAVIQAGLTNQAVQIEARVMRSGQITVQHADQKFSVILQPDCAEQVAIETLLKSWR